jgi:hypothetical protein
MSYSITKNDYFDKSQPAKSDELYNKVVVHTQPIVKSEESSELYRSDENIVVTALGTTAVECVYNSLPVISAIASLDSASVGVSILSAVYYCWGAVVTLQNTAVTPGAAIIVVTGTALSVSGEETVEDHDDGSITENGLLKYEYPINHLIQTRAMAETIAAALLVSYKTFRKDISLNWRGNPALELGDNIEAPIYQKNIGKINEVNVTGLFYIYKQKIDFDGTLKAVTEGRKTV